jgi:DNA-binding FrmR family transcriptional regulator
VRAALTKVETELLRGHLGHCIEGAIVSGDRDEQRRKAEELIELIERSKR